VALGLQADYRRTVSAKTETAENSSKLANYAEQSQPNQLAAQVF